METQPSHSMYNKLVDYFENHHRIRGFDLQSRSERDRDRNYHPSRVHSVSWNYDGSKIACGTADKQVAVGSVDSSSRVRTAFIGLGHAETVDCVDFHPTSPHVLASAGSDRSVCIWDIRQPKKHTKISTKCANLNVRWSPCCKYLIYGDKEDTLNIVDGRMFAPVKTHDSKYELNEFAFDIAGNYMVAALGSGKIDIFKVPTFEHYLTIQAHAPQTNCLSVCFSPNGERMAIGASDAICSVFDTQELICERTLSRLDFPVRTVSFSHDSQMIATASEDHFIDIAFAEDGRRVYTVPLDGETYSCAWHPSKHILAFAVNPIELNYRDTTTVRLFGLTS